MSTIKDQDQEDLVHAEEEDDPVCPECQIPLDEDRNELCLDCEGTQKRIERQQNVKEYGEVPTSVVGG